MRRWLGISAACAALGWSAAALAAPLATTPANPGQPSLAVGVDASGELRASVCRAAPCVVDAGQALGLPLDLRERLEQSRITIIPLGNKRYALHALVPRVEAERAWEALLVALPSGNVSVLFSGETGPVNGPEGERSGPRITISPPTADGSRRVVVGEMNESMTLCGRPAVVAPKLLTPGDLRLHPAKVQRLSGEERAGAPTIQAQVMSGAASAAPLLRAVSASSAVGNPSALTDSDLESTWAENRGGAGRGEFVLMLSPPELPIAAFELVVRPPLREIPHAVAPKTFFIAVTGKLFRVEMPEDAWRFPGRRYNIQLPAPVTTDCVALVTDDAFSDHKAVQVTFAELSARSDFDLTNLDGLVGALAGGGERAQAAGALLRSLGKPAFEAIRKRFEALDAGGRRVALDVMDHAECADSAPVYVAALLSREHAHRVHAEQRIRRCGSEAVAPLVRALDGDSARATQAARVLAAVAPAQAIQELVKRLKRASRLAGTKRSKAERKNARQRATYRAAIAVAAAQPAARQSVEPLLASAELSPKARIDLLRALSDQLPSFGAVAEQGVLSLLTPDADFRTRYLLVQPLAALSASSKVARSKLEALVTSDQRPQIRAAAAAAIVAPQLSPAALLHALQDDEVRVREAGVMALASAKSGFATRALISRLRRDEWPMVRSAAARSLASLPASAAIDAALASALSDSSSSVRRPALLALGARGGVAHALAVSQRLEDRDELPDVRSAAALALGRMCAKASVDLLTSYAVKLANPYADPNMRGIAAAALVSLARLQPQDLKSRLEPFFKPEVPAPARRAAQSALKAPRGC